MADWSGGMSASCKPRVQLFADAGNGWPHSALRYLLAFVQSERAANSVQFSSVNFFCVCALIRLRYLPGHT